MAIVRELLTKIGFEVDEKPLHHAESSVNKLKEGIEALLAALAIEKLFEFFKTAGEASEEIEKASMRMGIGVEAVQKLKYAAEQSGVEFATFSQSMTIFSRKLAGTEEQGGKLDGTLKKMGIDPKKFKDQDQLFLAVSDKFHDMEDGIKKTALAQELFGRGGASQISFLNKGSVAIKEMMDEADALNIVLGKEGVEGGVKFTRGLKTISAFVGALGNQIAARLFPYLNDLIKSFVVWAKANKEVIATKIEEFAKTLELVFRTLGTVIHLVIDAFKFFDIILTKLGRSLFGSEEGAKKFKYALLGIGAALLILESPILSIVALFALIGLAYDDVSAYLEGRPSLGKPVYDKIKESVIWIQEKWASLKQFFADVGLVLEHDFGITWTNIKTMIELAWDISPLKVFLDEMKTIYDFLVMLEDKFASSTVGKFLIANGGTIGSSFKEGFMNSVTGGLNGIIGLGEGAPEAISNRANEIRAQDPANIQASLRESARMLIAGLESNKNVLNNSRGLAKNGPVSAGVVHGDNTQNNHYNNNVKVDMKIETAQSSEEIGARLGGVVSDVLGKVLRDTNRATAPGAVN